MAERKHDMARILIGIIIYRVFLFVFFFLFTLYFGIPLTHSEGQGGVVAGFFPWILAGTLDQVRLPLDSGRFGIGFESKEISRRLESSDWFSRQSFWCLDLDFIIHELLSRIVFSDRTLIRAISFLFETNLLCGPHLHSLTRGEEGQGSCCFFLLLVYFFFFPSYFFCGTSPGFTLLSIGGAGSAPGQMTFLVAWTFSCKTGE